MGPPPQLGQAGGMPGSAGPTQGGGGKPGGGPQGMAGKMQGMMGGMGNAQMPVSDQMMKPPGGEQLPGSTGGKPGGGPPGAGGMGNPNSSAPQPEMIGGMPGASGGQFPGLPEGSMNRWGPGSSAGPGIPGPYQPIDPNTMLQRRPEGFGNYLGEVAGKGKIAPHERTAQSYGESYTRDPVQQKKGGK